MRKFDILSDITYSKSHTKFVTRIVIRFTSMTSYDKIGGSCTALDIANQHCHKSMAYTSLVQFRLVKYFCICYY